MKMAKRMLPSNLRTYLHKYPMLYHAHLFLTRHLFNPQSLSPRNQFQ